MDLEFTPEQEELRDAVRAVLARECPPSLLRALAETGDRSGVDALWGAMAALDWPALTVPEAHGGLGMGFVELTVVAEELGRVAAPGPLLPTLSQFVPAVREGGTPEQGDRFLGAVAAGELTGTLALATGVTGRREGDGWVLSGAAGYVMEGAAVDEIVVAARGDEGVGLFVVPRSAVRAEPLRSFDPTRQVATVHLDDVRVEPDRVLGGGETALTRVVEEATVALAVEMVGTCQTIFDVALEHARTREQFGVPIGSFQAVKHKFADMLVALERARATAYFAAVCVAEDDLRRSVAASVAKAAAGDCQRLLAGEGLQIMGGIGYTWEHDMHLYVKRAKGGDALMGTASRHRERVAEAAFEAAGGAGTWTPDGR